MFNRNDITQGETKLYSGRISWCRSEYSVLKGYGIVTDKSFRFDMPKIAKIMTVIFFKRFSAAFADGKYEITIPYTDIKNVAQGKYGFRKALVIETKDGSTYKFAVNNYNRWADIISERMILIA